MIIAVDPWMLAGCHLTSHDNFADMQDYADKLAVAVIWVSTHRRVPIASALVKEYCP